MTAELKREQAEKVKKLMRAYASHYARRDENMARLAEVEDAIDALAEVERAIETIAHGIYNEWEGQPGWVPWVDGGNSHKQDEARHRARAAIGATVPKPSVGDNPDPFPVTGSHGSPEVMRAALNRSSSGDAQAMAERFHEAYERLAPQFGYATRPETRTFDPQSANGRLMIAVCQELASKGHERDHCAAPGKGFIEWYADAIEAEDAAGGVLAAGALAGHLAAIPASTTSLPDGGAEGAQFVDCSACPKCGQTDKGQTGEYHCPECGLPTVWDGEPADAGAPVLADGGKPQ